MVTTTAWIPARLNTRDRVLGTATIDINETATLTIPCEGKSVITIGIPTIDSANLTFTRQPFKGASFRTLKDSSGNTVTVTAGTGGSVVTVPELSGAYAFTIVASAAQTSGAVEFEVQCVGQNPNASGSNEITIEGGTIDVVVTPSGNADATASQYVSTAAEDNALIKNAAGNLFGFTVASTTAQFVQLHNTATAPAGGAVPMRVWPIAANGTTQVVFDPPLRFSAGIWIGNSSTLASWTDAGDDCLYGVQYL